MSYGRRPYYIYRTRDGIEFVGHGLIPEEAAAQFITRLAARGTEALNEFIQLGISLDPGAFTDNFEVKVTGGFR